MTRPIVIGGSVVGQFPIFDFDGYTKVSGQGGSVTSTVWRDSVVQGAVSVVITEIGSSGEYKYEFTPSTEGWWNMELFIDYNKDIQVFDFEVASGGMSEVYDLVRRALGLIHENIFVDETVFDADGQLVTCRTRLFDSQTNCDLATDGGAETTGLLATYSLTSTWEGLNKFKIFKQTLEP